MGTWLDFEVNGQVIAQVRTNYGQGTWTPQFRPIDGVKIKVKPPKQPVRTD